MDIESETERKQMARTLVQIRQQIEKLEKEAESVRDREIAGVISRIKQAIGFYGLTVEDLFPSNVKRAGRPDGVAGSAVKKAAQRKAVAKYKDPNSDKTWTGHGKRPGWFVDAMNGGKKAEDLAI